MPAELGRIIDKCLEKDRDLRYQHASEIRADLQRLKRDTDSAPRARRRGSAAAKAGRRERWPVAGAAAAAVSALIAAGYFYFRRARRQLTDKDTIVLADFTNTTGDARV